MKAGQPDKRKEETKMARNELTMELKVEGLNEAIEKAKQLNELLEKAQSLIDSLSDSRPLTEYQPASNYVELGSLSKTAE